MTTRRSRVATAVVLGAAALAAASGAAAQSDADAPQHQLTVFSHGVSAKAGLFTYCRSVTPAQGVPTGICGDGVPGATATRVPVHRGGAVIVTIGAAVTYLVARYAAADGSGAGPALPVDALDATRRRFAVDLPDARPSDLLLVSIAYRDLARADGGRESGDAHFSVSLTEHRHPRRTPRAVIARAQVSCNVIASGQQRCRLSASGTVVRPPGVVGGCRGGRVRVRVLARGRAAMQATRPVTTACRHRVDERFFTLPAGVDVVSVHTRFLGSARLKPRNAPAIRIELR